MMVDTAQIMPITQLQKTLTQTVRKISEDKQPVFIMKNNAMEAVMMSFDRYEKLAELEELEEQKEIYRINEKNGDVSYISTQKNNGC